MTDYGNRFGHPKRRPNFVHMAVGLVLVTSIISLDLQVVRGFDLSALVAIIFFNYLFVFLLFPLEGPLSRKLVLLIAGNSVGFLVHPSSIIFGCFFLPEYRDFQDSVSSC